MSKIYYTKDGTELLRRASLTGGKIYFTHVELGSGRQPITVDNPNLKMLKMLELATEKIETQYFGTVALLNFIIDFTKIPREFKVSEIGIYAVGEIYEKTSTKIMMIYITNEDAEALTMSSSLYGANTARLAIVLPVNNVIDERDVQFIRDWYDWIRIGDSQTILYRDGITPIIL